MTQECAEYRALYEKMVLPPNVGPRVDWARVLEQKQVRGHPQCRRRLKELEVTHPQQQSQQYVSSGAGEYALTPGVVRGLGRERAEDTVQSGKASCRRRLWPQGDGLDSPERRNRGCSLGAMRSGVFWASRQNQIMGILSPQPE